MTQYLKEALIVSIFQKSAFLFLKQVMIFSSSLLLSL